MKSFWKLSHYCFLNFIRSKIFYGNLFFLFFLTLGLMLAASLSYMTPSKVVLDLGLGALSLWALALGLFMGVHLVHSEKGVFLTLLTQPTPRWKILIGRFFGAFQVLALSLLLIYSGVIFVFMFLGGTLNALIFWSYFFILVEGALVLILAQFFALFTTSFLSLFFTLSLYIVGHGLSSTLGLLKEKKISYWLLEGLQLIIPVFSKLSLREFVVYQPSLSLSYLLGMLFYGVVYAGVVLIFSCYLFSRKELT